MQQSEDGWLVHGIRVPCSFETDGIWTAANRRRLLHLMLPADRVRFGQAAKALRVQARRRRYDFKWSCWYINSWQQQDLKSKKGNAHRNIPPHPVD
ncbi:Uncharacterized protein APZ42_029368 [Daphnia magna]|uniref:Uncharacterized protein n=1 Tax=Daphnia magna TaxID=35525 RepID=A0A164PGN6_9CRUS|nr:Uncharacterized protein APZ42_029368 [Daphnia magna]